MIGIPLALKGQYNKNISHLSTPAVAAAAAAVAVLKSIPLALKGQCNKNISHLSTPAVAAAAVVACSCGDGYTANLKGTVS